jgi:Icc-related predicted phosphoesterase
MIKVAAVGDVHYDRHSRGRLCQYFNGLEEKADLFVLTGDLTQTGQPEEMRALSDCLKKCPIPIFTVLGNHDYHADQVETVVNILTDAGVTVLEGNSSTIKISNQTIGLCGIKGFGGGFVGACGSDFGESQMKSFIRYTKQQARIFEESLKKVEADYKIGLLHYSPTTQTLLGEKKEIYPFLGNYYLAEALDHGGADICFHGHAHHGVEKGETPGGCPVRNVAWPVIRHAFNIYSLERSTTRKKAPDEWAAPSDKNSIEK